MVGYLQQHLHSLYCIILDEHTFPSESKTSWWNMWNISSRGWWMVRITVRLDSASLFKCVSNSKEPVASRPVGWHQFLIYLLFSPPSPSPHPSFSVDLSILITLYLHSSSYWVCVAYHSLKYNKKYFSAKLWCIVLLESPMLLSTDHTKSLTVLTVTITLSLRDYSCAIISLYMYL